MQRSVNFIEFTLVDACNNTRIDTHFVNVVDTIGPEFSFTPPQELAIPFKCKDLVIWPLLDAYDMCSAVENVEWGRSQKLNFRALTIGKCQDGHTQWTPVEMQTQRNTS